MRRTITLKITYTYEYNSIHLYEQCCAIRIKLLDMLHRHAPGFIFAYHWRKSKFKNTKLPLYVTVDKESASLLLLVNDDTSFSFQTMAQ